MDAFLFDIVRRSLVAPPTYSSAMCLAALSHLVLTLVVALVVFRFALGGHRQNGGGPGGGGGGADEPVGGVAAAAPAVPEVLGAPEPPLTPLSEPRAAPLPVLLHEEHRPEFEGLSTSDVNDLCEHYHEVNRFPCMEGCAHEFDKRGSNGRVASGKCKRCGLLYKFKIDTQMLYVYRTRCR